MPGSVGTYKVSGARSEVLAEYFFGRWGPVLRGREDSDFGVDLYCALAEQVGQQMFVRDHYTVQVKSNLNPWKFETPEAVQWFIAHPTPLLLGVVDKGLGSIEVFQTFARFDLWVNGKYPVPLVLKPGDAGEGSVGNWDGMGNKYDLGAPILKVSAAELFDDKVLDERGKVLERWLAIERKNILLRDIGLMRFRGPATYQTNSTKFVGISEKGLGQPTDVQLEVALNVLGESLDCVGSQLGHRGQSKDVDVVALAMMLLRLLSNRGATILGIHPGVPVGALNSLVARRIPGEKYVFERLDNLLTAFSDLAKPLTALLERRTV